MSLFPLEGIEVILNIAEKIEVSSARNVFLAIASGVTSKKNLERIFPRVTLGKNCRYLVDNKLVEFSKCSNLYKLLIKFAQIRLMGTPVKRLAGKFLKKVENSFPVWDFLGVGWAVKSFGQESR